MNEEQRILLDHILQRLHAALPTFDVQYITTEHWLVTFYVSRSGWHVQCPISLSLATEAGIEIAQHILGEIEPFLAEAPPAPTDS